jgi:hypothetical protein
MRYYATDLIDKQLIFFIVIQTTLIGSNQLRLAMSFQDIHLIGNNPSFFVLIMLI